MKKTIYYTCRHCGETNELTGFGVGFSRPTSAIRSGLSVPNAEQKNILWQDKTVNGQ